MTPNSPEADQRAILRILVIDLGAGPSRGTEEAAIGHLAAAGCYGEVSEPATPESLQEPLIMESVRRSGECALVLAGARDFYEVEDAWGYLRLAAVGGDEIGRLLESLEDDVLVLALAEVPDGRGAFILAAPNSPLRGELAVAGWSDLGLALLEMAGRLVPPGMKGASLLSGASPGLAGPELSEDEESLLRERLKGLGYIG